MAIKKKEFGDIKKQFSSSAKYKPQRYLDLGKDFLDAVGLPGPAVGHLNMFLGHSDTGKTTGAVKAAVRLRRWVFYPYLLLQSRNGVLNTHS